LPQSTVNSTKKAPYLVPPHRNNAVSHKISRVRDVVTLVNFNRFFLHAVLISALVDKCSRTYGRSFSCEQ